MAYRYRLSSLLNWTVLICFMLWVSQRDGGAQLLGGIGFLIVAALAFLALVHLITFLYGIPGEMQRKRARRRNDSHVKYD